MNYSLALVVTLVLCSCGMAQQPPAENASFSPQERIFAILKMPHVRAELEMVDSQEEKWKDLEKRITEAWNKIETSVRKESKPLLESTRKQAEEAAPERVQELWKNYQKREAELRKTQLQLYEEIAKRARAEVDEILLPQQRDRLKQLALQQRYRYASQNRHYFATQEALELMLTDEQKQQQEALYLESVQKGEELNQRFMRENMELWKAHEKKCLDILSPKQRKLWQAKYGEPFNFEPSATSEKSPSASDSADKSAE